MKRGVQAVFAVLALGSAAAPAAEADAPGLYAVGAAGVNRYDYDCGFYFDCDQRSSTALKFGIGGRGSTSMAFEAWVIDFGRIRVDSPPATLRLRALVGDVAWSFDFGPQTAMLLRVGLSLSQNRRSDDGTNTEVLPYLGLGLAIDLAPRTALELGWDFTHGNGNNTSSTFASALTAGLRLRF